MAPGPEADGKTMQIESVQTHVGTSGPHGRLAREQRLRIEVPQPAPMTRFGHLVTVSPRTGRIFELLGRLAPTDLTLTFVGETGVGKDVLANAVHAASDRAAAPFVVFDCGAVAANLAESELFGHERGSFTGAVSAHVGAFERAQGGTLFLDEAGELPLDLQTRLLRALEGRRIRRVGGTEDRAVDVRVIAATNRDLPAEIAAGRFRQDLFFRLAGAVLPVPSLRNRVEDIPLLAELFLLDLGRPDVELTSEALSALLHYHWPGNVRELKNVLGCALALTDGARIEPRHLRLPSRAATTTDRRLRLGGLALETIERAAIRQTLAANGGNKSRAARALGIAVSTLYEKMKKYGI